MIAEVTPSTNKDIRREMSVFKVGILFLGIHLLFQALQDFNSSLDLGMMSYDVWRIYNVLLCVVDVCVGVYLLRHGSLTEGTTLLMTGILLTSTTLLDIKSLQWSLWLFVIIYLNAGLIFRYRGDHYLAAVSFLISIALLCEIFLEGRMDILGAVVVLSASAVSLVYYFRLTYCGYTVPYSSYRIAPERITPIVLSTVGQILFSLTTVYNFLYSGSYGEEYTMLALFCAVITIVTMGLWLYGIHVGLLAEGVSILLFLAAVAVPSTSEMLGMEAVDLLSLALLIPIIPLLIVDLKSKRYSMFLIRAALEAVVIYEALVGSDMTLDVILTVEDVLYALLSTNVWYIIETGERPWFTALCSRSMTEGL